MNYNHMKPLPVNVKNICAKKKINKSHSHTLVRVIPKILKHHRLVMLQPGCVQPGKIIDITIYSDITSFQFKNYTLIFMTIDIHT